MFSRLSLSTEARNRFIAAVVILTVIPMGLLARSYRSGADPSTVLGVLVTYLGDTLWPVMFYFAGRFCAPNASRQTLLLTTLGITLALEFGQLWKPPFLMWLRQQPMIGFVLGTHFIWSDVVCCVVGTFCALLVDFVLIPRNQ